MSLLNTWGEAAQTTLGFFWKAGWAFVLGYSVSAMIQAFVPKARLTRHLGDQGAKSVSLASLFGASSHLFLCRPGRRPVAGTQELTLWRPWPSCSPPPTW